MKREEREEEGPACITGKAYIHGSKPLKPSQPGHRCSCRGCKLFRREGKGRCRTCDTGARARRARRARRTSNEGLIFVAIKQRDRGIGRPQLTSGSACSILQHGREEEEHVAKDITGEASSLRNNSEEREPGTYSGLMSPPRSSNI